MARLMFDALLDMAMEEGRLLAAAGREGLVRSLPVGPHVMRAVRRELQPRKPDNLLPLPRRAMPFL